MPWEKALYATAEKVAFDYLDIWQGTIAEDNAEAADLSTFKAKADIRSALSLVDDVKVLPDDLKLGNTAKKMHRHFCRTTKALKSAWDHSQTASLANAGVKYASIATVDVGARAVHSGLCTLRAQAPRVGTCAQAHQAEVLAKYANTIPFSNQSFLGGGLNTVVAKAASAARDYSAMAEGFV